MGEIRPNNAGCVADLLGTEWRRAWLASLTRSLTADGLPACPPAESGFTAAKEHGAALRAADTLLSQL